MSTFLWVIFPYIALAVFVVGHIWRYKYDKFGWTTRSSQLYESRMLRIASPLFHFGVLFAVLGHVMGLVFPKSWTDAIGISQHNYHLVAVIGGLVSGAMIIVGFTILVFRRRTTKAVFNATTRNDKAMYLLLGIAIATGMWNTISTTLSDEYNYREGVSVWFRSIFALSPDASMISSAPIQFQLHALTAFLLVLVWPFTRLVHVFSAPIGYLNRPYIVYRSAGHASGAGPKRMQTPQGTWNKPGWDGSRPGTRKKEKTRG
ncbi:respiratory nitrate reductase subunit gamma [Tessaracoccus sp. SD287]|uniref:respiratory nitrate reductase subunit gamma n=1 Tax=Tessaracoccus sp. SD287 TaxID=2782008 RepID=UPI001A969A23|nr:respiratory nitrate reductase subunit gamma [Tessaracoccus sp. SD287]MBO1030452.1 respiratory nitrate reductase subunit gamma [Tessaracoccus sp. SD287]